MYQVSYRDTGLQAGIWAVKLELGLRTKMPNDSYTIEHDAGAVNYPGSTLLVGIDETGHEEFADPKHPVFGLGGCATLLKHYDESIDRPWRYMKERFFYGAEVPLHAADLRAPTNEQIEALEHFFTKFPFYRFAVMSASTFQNNVDVSLIQLVCGSVWERIATIAKWSQPTEVVVVVEQSDRIKRDVYGYLAGYEIGHDPIRIKPRIFFSQKNTVQPFMEVADFVMHPAGAQVRNRILGRFGVRQDFSAVFHRVDRRFSDYVELLAANPEAQQGTPGDEPKAAPP